MAGFGRREMILDKAKMAHDYAIEMLKRGDPERRIAFDAWQYADAMQAEADKRKSKPELPSLQQTFINGVEQPRYAPTCEEWQPDWSQAPEWAGWFSVSKDGSAQWMKSSGVAPYIGGCGSMFFSMGIFKREPCETFNYQGNWQDSLRKRPQ